SLNIYSAMQPLLRGRDLGQIDLEDAAAEGDGDKFLRHPEKLIDTTTGRAFVRGRPGFAVVLAGEHAHLSGDIKVVGPGRMNDKIADRHRRFGNGFVQRSPMTAAVEFPDVPDMITPEGRVNDVVIARVDREAMTVTPRSASAGGLGLDPVGNFFHAVGGLENSAAPVGDPNDIWLARRNGDGTDIVTLADRFLDRRPGRT